jgi:hypothetical protein
MIFYLILCHDRTLLGHNNADENITYLFINMCSTCLEFELVHNVNHSRPTRSSVSIHTSILNVSSNKTNESWQWDWSYDQGIAMFLSVMVRSSNTSDLNSKGTRFKSRSEHWIALQIFRGFPQSLQANAGTVPRIGQDPYKFTVRPNIRHYIF